MNYDIKTPFLVKTTGFNGTHAILMNKKFYTETINIMNNFLENKNVPAIDGLLSYVLQLGNVNCFSIIYTEYFFEQMKGIYSYIIEGVRK
jgi:hypothetical protein